MWLYHPSLLVPKKLGKALEFREIKSKKEWFASTTRCVLPLLSRVTHNYQRLRLPYLISIGRSHDEDDDGDDDISSLLEDLMTKMMMKMVIISDDDDNGDYDISSHWGSMMAT